MAETVKNIAVIGSTGSIGRQTLEVVRALPGRFQIVALAAGQNTVLLSQQVEEFKPRFIAAQEHIKPSRGVKVLTIEKIVALPDIDIVVMAISGVAGLGAVLAAVSAGKTIALANKESLVAAGEIITAEAKKSGARIFPVDSEHSAIWQCLDGEKQKPRRIILTASGGPLPRLLKKASGGH